jgi:large subunit ribosomal protein L24
MQGLKKGDIVEVITGKEKGRTGKILKVLSEKDRVVVEKLNLVKKHKKPDNKSKGGVVEKEGSIHASNVLIVCNKCDTGVRIGYKILEDGKKVRVCGKCKEILEA